MSRDLTRRPVRGLAVAGLAGLVVLLAAGGCTAPGGSEDADLSAGAASDRSAPRDGAGPIAGPTSGPNSLESGDAALGAGLFSEDSPWNTTVTDAPVHPSSWSMLEEAKFAAVAGYGGLDQRRRVTGGLRLDVGESSAAPVVAGGVPTLLRCRQVECGDGERELVLDVAADVDPDPRGEGRFTIVDTDAGLGYDLLRARRENDGSLSYLTLRSWDLDGPGFSQPYIAGARGSGLPLAAGLISRAELAQGSIHHALAISVPGPSSRYFVAPASTTDGTNTNELALPEGARIRLRPGTVLELPVDHAGRPLALTAEQEQYAATIIETLQTYGAVVVGRAPVPTLHVEAAPPAGPGGLAEDAAGSGALRGWELQALELEDFEVVDFADSDRLPWPATAGTTGTTGTWQPTWEPS